VAQKWWLAWIIRHFYLLLIAHQRQLTELLNPQHRSGSVNFKLSAKLKRPREKIFDKDQ
jgi:hypothetical protein